MGDIGTMDSRGFLKVTGRVKDMIIRGGINLYPAEIEGALTDHPAIEHAAVIGVPDEHWGEQVGAVLHRARPATTGRSVAELTDFLRDQIAPHKTPVFWTFVDALPDDADRKDPEVRAARPGDRGLAGLRPDAGLDARLTRGHHPTGSAPAARRDPTSQNSRR